jgi:hypothetical protein
VTAPAFTPGPWKIDRAQRPPHHLLVLGPKGQAVGMIFVRPPDPTVEQRANADLIEHAPLLFAELVNCCTKLEALGEAADDALLALVKAGGRRR